MEVLINITIIISFIVSAIKNEKLDYQLENYRYSFHYIRLKIIKITLIHGSSNDMEYTN